MSLEGPAVSAIIARLPYPTINLAAFGGIVFPIALIIEAPIIMLLAASTALSKDYASYQKLRRFMMLAGGSLTLLHILVAFTPLYYVVVVGIIGAPEVIVEPARYGLMIMTPWTWAIAYRRFNQGVLIRFGHSQTVAIGTGIRLATDVIVLVGGYLIGSIPGVVIASAAIAAGVVSEAVYTGVVVRPVVINELKQAETVKPPLTRRAFLDFYIPLAMTSLIILLANPIGSAALSRMPQPLISLAVWPVVGGLVFLFRSLGIAYNEVVVALLDKPHSSYNLRRYTVLLSGAATSLLLIIVLTPLSTIWFERVLALSPELSELAQTGLLIALPLPALSVWQSWYQGAILHSRRTRGITESVVIYLVTSAIVLGSGVIWGKTIGIYFGLAALT
ncbi:MAG: hypothetical protein MUO67_08175, partial [Anaerolineales bacterium]|nr:hypothetical protein [Anaerolineales bacterium]